MCILVMGFESFVSIKFVNQKHNFSCKRNCIMGLLATQNNIYTQSEPMKIKIVFTYILAFFRVSEGLARVVYIVECIPAGLSPIKDPFFS